MDNKTVSNFLSVMIFMTVIIGAILFACFEFGVFEEMKKANFFFFFGLIIGVAGFITATICALFCSAK